MIRIWRIGNRRENSWRADEEDNGIEKIERAWFSGRTEEEEDLFKKRIF